MGSASGASADDYLGGRIEKPNSSNYSVWKFKTKMLLLREELWQAMEPLEEGATAKQRETIQKKYV